MKQYFQCSLPSACPPLLHVVVRSSPPLCAHNKLQTSVECIHPASQMMEVISLQLHKYLEHFKLFSCSNDTSHITSSNNQTLSSPMPLHTFCSFRKSDTSFTATHKVQRGMQARGKNLHSVLTILSENFSNKLTILTRVNNVGFN